jgi:hypothetical protein
MEKQLPSPRTIVLEYLADGLGGVSYFIARRSAECRFLSDESLFEYVAGRTRCTACEELLRMVASAADALNIDNSGNQFEERVIDPIKRAQGIYY